MYFSQMDRAIGKSDSSDALSFSPPAAAVDFSEAGDFTNAGSRRKGLDVRNGAQDLELHRAIVSPPWPIVNETVRGDGVSRQNSFCGLYSPPRFPRRQTCRGRASAARKGASLAPGLRRRGKDGARPRAALARKSALMESGPCGCRLRFAAGLSLLRRTWGAWAPSSLRSAWC